jgi:hypothetical protein
VHAQHLLRKRGHGSRSVFATDAEFAFRGAVCQSILHLFVRHVDTLGKTPGDDDTGNDSGVRAGLASASPAPALVHLVLCLAA